MRRCAKSSRIYLDARSAECAQRIPKFTKGILTNVSQDEEDPPAEPPEVTLQLRRFGDGDEQARAELMRVIEPELRRLAAWQMRGEHGSHTLQTTALVNEAYIRLFGSGGAEFNGRNHFLSVASRVMRQVLVDYARARHASKRDGEKVSLNSVDVAFTPMQPDLLDVHGALLRDLRQRAVLPDCSGLSGRTAEPRGGIVCQRRSGEDGVVRGLGDAADFAGPVDLVGLCAPN